MKKVVIFLIIAFFLNFIQIGISRADQRSFEEEILEILKEEKIITQEKYQELTHKLKAEGKSVNEEILEILKEKKIVSQAKYEQLKQKAVDDKKATRETFEIPEGLKGVKFKGLWYIDYKSGSKSDSGYNEWSLTRGYIDFRKKFTPWLSVRVTPDIKRDDTGDYKLRLKYLYGRLSLPDFKGIFTKNYIEAGLIHMPWLDFEEHVNPYRCQGTMFLERNHIFNSADLGVGLFGYFGEEMPDEYKKHVDSHFAGRYGSYALGVYNGGGYHAPENNDNKVFEGRITLRPFPDLLPGLQFSYFGLRGKGNIEEKPDWKVDLAFLSYENAWGRLVGQYAWCKGSQKGKYKLGGVDIVDERDKEGFSFFGFLRVPWDNRFRVFGRYDYWDPDTDVSGDIERRYMGGLSFDIYKGCMLIMDYENLDYENGRADDDFFQTVLQIKY